VGIAQLHMHGQVHSPPRGVAMWPVLKLAFCTLLLLLFAVYLVQDPKLLMELESRGNGPLDQRTVTVCSGLDLVNITYNNFVAADEKSAAV